MMLFLTVQVRSPDWPFFSVMVSVLSPGEASVSLSGCPSRVQLYWGPSPSEEQDTLTSPLDRHSEDSFAGDTGARGKMNNCHVHRMNRTKVQRGMRTFFIILRMNTEQTNQNNKTTIQMSADRQLHIGKIPRNTKGKWLPEYDPQSETTINSGL